MRVTMAIAHSSYGEHCISGVALGCYGATLDEGASGPRWIRGTVAKGHWMRGMLAIAL